MGIVRARVCSIESSTIVPPGTVMVQAGAIVGKYATSRKLWNPLWWGEHKTVLGSTAVFLVSFLTIMYPVTLAQRAVIALVAMFAEAIGGAYDNLLLVAAVLCGWY